MGPVVILLSQLVITKTFTFGIYRSYPKGTILTQQNRLLANGAF